MWPFELRKFEPATWTDSPAAPLEGLSAEITGAAPGVAGGAALGVVPFDEGGVAAGDPPPDVDGWCAGCEPPAWLGVVTAEEVVAARGEPLPWASETARPIVVAASSTATTATAATSQRSSSRAPPGLAAGEWVRAGDSVERG